MTGEEPRIPLANDVSVGNSNTSSATRAEKNEIGGSGMNGVKSGGETTAAGTVRIVVQNSIPSQTKSNAVL